MIYGSVCSGIGAPEVAWTRLGWHCAFLAEIEPFPRAVLAHRFPRVPLRRDFRAIRPGQHEAIDLLVAGTPCQSFSVGSTRRGIADARGSLALGFMGLADRLGARWILWENVPGVLSSRGGRDFGAIVGALAEGGYGYAWRVLDARYFGCACPRARLYLVGYRGDWRPCMAALFEPGSLQGNAAPVGAEKPGNGAPVLTAHGGMALDDRTACIVDGDGIRLSTPREWKRALGFPDDWTAVPWRGRSAADAPRYRAIGNAMAVPVVRWIGERIAMADAPSCRPCLTESADPSISAIK